MQETTGSEFEHLIEIYSPILLNKAYYLLSNKEDAEDIVQEVFISAYVNYHLFKNKSSIKSWLMGILYNKVMDRSEERRVGKEWASAWRTRWVVVGERRNK